MPPIDDNFNDHIFNTDESDNDEEDSGIFNHDDVETSSGIYNNSFSLASLSSPLLNGNLDSPSTSPRRLTTPAGEGPPGDPLSLNLPSLNFLTPKHEFSRQFSLPQESPTDFEKFTSVIDVGSPHRSLPQFLSPPRTNIDDLDLRDLLSTKSLPPASPAPRTPLSIENLLEIDPRSSADQLQDIIETVVNTKSSTPSITEVPSSPAPLDPKAVLFNPSPRNCSHKFNSAFLSPKTISSPNSSSYSVAKSPNLSTKGLKPTSPPSLSHITKSSSSAPFSSKNASDIVSHLDDLISSNESKVQLSAIPKSDEPPVLPKRQKPKKSNFARPDVKKIRSHLRKSEQTMSSNRPIDPRLVTRKPSVSGKISSPRTGSPPISDTSSTLESLASSLGIVKPAESSFQNMPNAMEQNATIHAVNSVSQPGKPTKLGNAPSQPMVIGKSGSQSKPGQRYLNKPVIISQIPPQAVIKTKPIVKSTKIVSASVKQYPNSAGVKTYTSPDNTTGSSAGQSSSAATAFKTSPNASNKHSIVPYKTPAQTTKPENNKYVLLPLDKLKNASPAVLSQLGLDKALPNSTKRPVTVETGPEKRIKTDPPEPSTSFTEKTTFPINIKLPNSTKERLSSEYHGSIPEMIEKARAKRKSNLSNMSTFTQMENFINEFIQQNNDQVMEILFLKKNNKEINSKFNQLAKLFHVKNEEHKKLKEEVTQISAQNKKMEKELKMINDVIKKYMTS